MEVSENMTYSAKNDKAILNAVSWKLERDCSDEIPIRFPLWFPVHRV